MSISASPATSRDAFGRWVPGRSGNPVGKKKGTRNRATLLAAALAEGEGEKLARLVIDKAFAGDNVAARFLLARLCPAPRGRAIALDLPRGARAGDVVALFNATLAAMAAGEITPEEALAVARVIEGRTRALRAWQLEKKLTRYGEVIPGDALAAAHDEDDEDEDEGRAADIKARDPQAEPSPACGRGQGEGVRASSGPHPNPFPLPRKPQVSAAATGDATPRLERTGEGTIEQGQEPPIGTPYPESLLRDAVVESHAASVADRPSADAPNLAERLLHSACIQPSLATIQGRREVARRALRQFAQSLR